MKKILFPLAIVLIAFIASAQSIDSTKSSAQNSADRLLSSEKNLPLVVMAKYIIINP